jgi:hypothetical protein
MNKHGLDKQAAKRAAELINAGMIAEARRVIAAMSPDAQKEIVKRIEKGVKLHRGRQ